MKKAALALALFPFLLSAANAAVEGETSTINFTGKIVESTCTLDEASKGQHVDLGTVSANAFSAENTTNEGTHFSIGLADCSTDTYYKAKIKYHGDTVVGKNQVLSVTGGATNIGLQILYRDTPLELDGTESTSTIPLNDGPNRIWFLARYISLDNVVGVGDANANVNFTVSYE